MLEHSQIHMHGPKGSAPSQNRLAYMIRERPNIISVLPNKGREEAYLPTKQQMELLINYTF